MKKLTSIQLTKDQVSVLGRPNFACANMAKVLIAGGLYAEGPPKAEYEQAVFIHWASNLLDKHGENWGKEGDKILKELCEKIKGISNDTP